MNPKTCDQNCVKFPSLTFDIWCSQGFRDAQTHARIDRPEYSMPTALFLMVGEAQKSMQ